MVIDLGAGAVGGGNRNHIAESVVGITGFAADFVAFHGNAAEAVAVVEGPFFAEVGMASDDFAVVKNLG